MSNKYIEFLKAAQTRRRAVMRLLKQHEGNMAEVGRIMGLTRERIRQIKVAESK